jgi:hypothetical protein
MAVTHEGKGLATEVATIGPAAEAVAGVAIIVLAILALANIAPQSLAAIAAIVTGAALLLQVTDATAEYAASMTAGTEVVHTSGVGSGMSVGFLAGGAGIVLGILALLGVGTMHLIAAALIVFGGAWLLGAGVAAETARHRLGAVATDTMGLVQQAVGAAAGAQALIGLTSIILGILAFMPMPQMVLILVAFLALGGSLLLTGAAAAGTLTTIWRR